MAPKNNAQRIGNISANNFVPIPNFEMPPFPARLQSIDPTGCAKFQADFNQAHAEWVKTVNVLQRNITSNL